jgi:hypothetical protein
MSAVGYNALAGIYQLGFDSASRERSFDDPAGKHLTEGGDVIGSSRGQLADCGNAAQEFI